MIEDFALIDWFSVTLIITFGLIGLFNGFVKEVFSAAAWILSLLIAWVYGPFLFPFVLFVFPFSFCTFVLAGASESESEGERLMI